jgi:tRNA wybutosine-synthesizing protein 3
MPIDMFLRRKKDILEKDDKSFAGEIDEKIRKLCEKINSLKDCYTTSSCSGRIVLMIDEEKKGKGLMLKIYHDLISLEQLKKDLNELIKTGKNIRFKMEPCALHVACKSFEDAQKICELARFIGWRRTGIISSERRFVIEMNSTEKLDFPIARKGKILIDDNFLKIIAEDANRKLKKCWWKIEELEKKI